MKQKLNPHQKDIYQEYDGESKIIFPQIKADGNHILSIEEILKNRIEQRDSMWPRLSLDSSDLLLRHPNGNIKVEVKSKIISGINRNTIFTYNNIYFGEFEDSIPLYEKNQGIEIKKKDIEKGIVNPTENHIWRALVEDVHLLEEYVRYKQLTTNSYNKPRKIMNVELEQERKRVTGRILGLYNTLQGSNLTAINSAMTAHVITKKPTYTNSISNN